MSSLSVPSNPVVTVDCVEPIVVDSPPKPSRPTPENPPIQNLSNIPAPKTSSQPPSFNNDPATNISNTPLTPLSNLPAQLSQKRPASFNDLSQPPPSKRSRVDQPKPATNSLPPTAQAPKMTIFDGINARVPDKPKLSTPTMSRSEASRDSDDITIASLAKQSAVKKVVPLSAEEREAHAANKNLKATVSSLMKKKLVEKPLFDPLLINLAPPRLIMASWDRFIFHTYHPRPFQFRNDIYLSKLSPFASVAEEMETVEANGVCATCGGGDNLLPCSRCPLGFHKRCVDPHNKVPLVNEKWHCPACYHAVLHEQKNDPAPPEVVPGETGVQALRRLATYASEGNAVDNVLMPSLFHVYRQRAKADWMRCVLCNKVTFVSDGAIAEALPVPFRCENAFWEPNAYAKCGAIALNNGVNSSISGMVGESPAMKRVVKYLSGSTRRRSRMKWFREFGQPGEEWINYPKLQPVPPKLPKPTPPPPLQQPAQPPPTLLPSMQPVPQNVISSQTVAKTTTKSAVAILPKGLLPPMHPVPVFTGGIMEKMSVSNALPPQPASLNRTAVSMGQVSLHPPSRPLERVSVVRIGIPPSQSASAKRTTVSASQAPSHQIPSRPLERKGVARTPPFQPVPVKKTSTISPRPLPLNSILHTPVEGGSVGNAATPYPPPAKMSAASLLPTHAKLSKQPLEIISGSSAAAFPPIAMNRATTSASQISSPAMPGRSIERISANSKATPPDVMPVKRITVSASQAPSNRVSSRPVERTGTSSSARPQPAPVKRTTVSASQVMSNARPGRPEGVMAMSQGSVANSTCDVKNPQSTEDLQSKVMEYVSGLEIEEWIEDVLTDLAMESNFKLFKLYSVFHKKKDKFIRHATRLAKSQKLD